MSVTLLRPAPNLEDADLRTYKDGVTYNGPYWYVSFDYGETEEVLEFSYGDLGIPVEELSDEKEEKIREHGFIHNGEFSPQVERLSQVHDAVLDYVAEEYDIAGHELSEPEEQIDADSWLYEGECPECGPELLIERLGESDICYECGTEVTDS